ncbi:MAG: site-2 protease family protein [Phycisphaerales bacterium]
MDNHMDLMNNPLFSMALIVLGFGFLIFVHELGHFVVAKMVGIKTTQFAIGFGHSLLTWRKGLGFRVGTTEPEYEKLLAEGADPKTLGETEYRLNYIPLGGYVKMLGQEDMDPSARSDDPRAFNNKSVSARFAVISAGVIMNIIFGMIFFVIAFTSGVKFPPAIVGDIAPDAPATKFYAVGHENDPDYLGLKIDDRITHIDGKPVDDMMDVKYATILGTEDTPITLTVQRPGESADLTYPIKPKMNDLTGFFWIGIDSPLDLEVTGVTEGSEAEAAGLEKGMRITAVNGQPVSTYSEYDRAVNAERGREVKVTLSDPASGKTVEMKSSAIPLKLISGQSDETVNILGLVPPVIINGVAKKSPAMKAGMQAGDLIAAVDGKAWPSLDEFKDIVTNSTGDGVAITVLRDGEEVRLGPVKPSSGRIGVVIGLAAESDLIGHTFEATPLSTHTIPGGSKFVALNGEAIQSWADLQRGLADLAGGGKPFVAELTYELNIADRPHETVKTEVGAEQADQLAQAGWLAAIPDGMEIDLLRVPVVGEGPFDATALGFKKTHQWITNTYMTLLRLTQGTVPADKLSGPVGIVHQGTIIAQGGWQYLLFFLGLISINLAVINFLPIPITDGGQAVFLIAEKIKGSPVSVRVQTAATIAGLAVLGCVFLFVTYNDVLRLLGGS